MKNRWKITGTFTTTTPMHVGSGHIGEDQRLLSEKRKEAGEKNVDVQAVVKDYDSKPCIPGTAIKGVLRAWAETHFAGHEAINRIFGPEDCSHSGWAEFGNAMYLTSLKNRYAEFVPYWNPKTFTGIMSHVAIDRETGAAKKSHLFFEEFVPEGVVFQFEIEVNRLVVAEIEFLLGILKTGAIEGDTQYQFGANGADGWGRVKCSDLKVEQIYGEKVGVPVAKVLSLGVESPPVDDGADKKVGTPVANEVPPPTHQAFDLTLKFNGPFLVNDASREKKKSMSDAEKLLHTTFTPLRRANGNIWLPASSFRGALRSRFEFLAMSKFPNDWEASSNRIFGDTGRATRLTIEEFREIENDKKQLSKIQHQDFVAIDRFTGGAADGAKFDAKYADRPVLKTRMVLNTKVELTEAEKKKPNSEKLLAEKERLFAEAQSLLAAALRDVCAGKVTFGFGGSKGYGEATGTLCDGEGWLHKHFKPFVGQVPSQNRFLEPAQNGSQTSDGEPESDSTKLGTLEYKRSKQGTMEWTLKPDKGRVSYPKDGDIPSSIPRKQDNYRVEFNLENNIVSKIRLPNSTAPATPTLAVQTPGDFVNPYYFQSPALREGFAVGVGSRPR